MLRGAAQCAWQEVPESLETLPEKIHCGAQEIAECKAGDQRVQDNPEPVEKAGDSAPDFRNMVNGAAAAVE